MKSMFWSPTFKVTMGSRGPDISEPRQPYLISKSASPTTAGASSSFLALGHSFFQWPKAQHQSHWFGCNGALGLHALGLRWDRLKDCPAPGAEEFFRRAQNRLSQSSSWHCKSLVCSLSFLWLPGRAQFLLNSNVSLPFLSVFMERGGYSLDGLAGAGFWKCWPEASVTRIGAC